MNIGALIPIRLKSERLPNKAMLEIRGRPVCFHLFDQIFASRFITKKKQIIVCTTDQISDDPLVELALDYGCSVFRGHPYDIINRFYSAMMEFNLDLVIQADGDDPLSSTEYMDLTMETLLADKELDIVTIEGLPLGCATKSFTQKAISKIKSSYLTENNDTGFIYYFTKTGLCNHLELICSDPTHQYKNARLTLDYKEDFFVFKNIIESIKKENNYIALEKVVTYLTENPDLAASNIKIEAEYWQRTREKAKLQYRSSSDESKFIEI